MAARGYEFYLRVVRDTNIHTLLELPSTWLFSHNNLTILTYSQKQFKLKIQSFLIKHIFKESS